MVLGESKVDGKKETRKESVLNGCKCCMTLMTPHDVLWRFRDALCRKVSQNLVSCRSFGAGPMGRTPMGSDGFNRILHFQPCQGTPCNSENT